MAAYTAHRILVAGATGGVGRHVVKRLLMQGGLTNRRMTVEPLVVREGRAGGTTSRQAVADVAVRCLSSPDAVGAVLTVVDGAMRLTLSGGRPFLLSEPWTPW